MVAKALVEEVLATERQFDERETLSEVMLVRLPPSLKQVVTDIAAERRQTLSSEIRRLLFDYLRQYLAGLE